MLLRYVWGILSEPKATWARIRDEETPIPEIYLRVLAPLALISPVAGFIGTTQFGWQIGAGAPLRLTVSSAARISVVYFGAILVTVFVIGALIFWMSDTYGAKQPLSRCVAIAVYSAVPLLLVGFAQVYPVLWINFLIGLPALTGMGMAGSWILAWRDQPLVRYTASLALVGLAATALWHGLTPGDSGTSHVH